MAATESILEVSGLSKHFGPIQALNDVSFGVKAGEFVALLGLNGAGKSTLLQLLTGLFSPDAGSIRVLGHDLRTEATTALRSIGVVFQQQTLDLEMSVRANLLFHADLHGLPRRNAIEKIDAALQHFNLLDRQKESVRNLSGGNRRRVELARALLHAPALLLMDEATTGLDPASRRMLVDDIIATKRDHGVGVLWATHLVDEIEEADRLLVLHRGQLLYEGAPQALVERMQRRTLADAFLALTETHSRKDVMPAL